MNKMNYSNNSLDYPLDHNISQEVIQQFKQSTCPISYIKIRELIRSFIRYKKQYGTPFEKHIYSNLKIKSFITRLLQCRPVSFYGNKEWLLKDGTVGQDDLNSPSKYITNDETCIASLLSISGHSLFFNNGNRYNCGQEDNNRTNSGIIIGQCPPRLHIEGEYEWNHMVIDPVQNTNKNGYGKQCKNSLINTLWTTFYEVDYFPEYKEVERLINPERIGLYTIPGTNNYFNAGIYKKYISTLAMVFLGEANRRAKEEHKMAFCHITNLGLDIPIHPNQINWFVDVFMATLQEFTFEYISIVHFNQINTEPIVIDNIEVVSGPREPFDKIPDNLLLVVNYEWSAYAYPGNEYWVNKLSASNGSASACASSISYTQTPDTLSGKSIKLYG